MNPEKQNQRKHTDTEDEAIHKKTVSACIMDILEHCSNEHHRLSLDEIVDLIPGYGYTAQRKAVSDHLVKLCEVFDGTDKQIYYSETKGEHPKRTGFYLNPPSKFNEGELDSLINFVKYSPNFQKASKKSLIERLESMGPCDYCYTDGLLDETRSFQKKYEEFFGNLDCINTAIRHRRQISFDYYEYDKTGTLQKVSEEPVFFNPFQVVSKNDRYYLIGTLRGQTGLKHFRVDKIKYVQEEETPLQICDSVFNHVEHYLDSHPDMTEGRVIRICMEAKENAIGRLVDAFGTDITVRTEPNTPKDRCIAEVYSTEDAAVRFALEHAGEVQILSPQPLRIRMKKIAGDLSGTYLQTGEDYYFEELEPTKKNRKSEFLCSDFDLRKKTEHLGINPKRVILRKNQLKDISFVSAYTNLCELKVIWNPIEDLAPLKNLEKLQYLSLMHTEIHSIECLKELKSLRFLELNGNPIQDYRPLLDCLSLEYLILGVGESAKIDIASLQEKFPKLVILESSPLLLASQWNTQVDIDSSQTDAPYPLCIYESLISRKDKAFPIGDPTQVRKKLMQDAGLMDILHRAIEGLNEKQRTVAEKIWREQLSYRQTAKQTEMTVEETIRTMDSVREEFRKQHLRVQCGEYYSEYYPKEKDPMLRWNKKIKKTDVSEPTH